MSDDVEAIVKGIISEVTGVAVADLHPDRGLSEVCFDGDDFDEIIEQCCKACSVSLNHYINSSPMYRIRASETTMESLRNLAPFNKKAAVLLNDYDIQFEDETVASLVASMRAGKYVSSGKTLPRAFPPKNGNTVLFWVAFLLIAAPAASYALTLIPCNQAYASCNLHPLAKMRGTISITLLISGLCIGSMFVPAFFEMFRVHRRKTLKDKSAGL